MPVILTFWGKEENREAVHSCMKRHGFKLNSSMKGNLFIELLLFRSVSLWEFTLVLFFWCSNVMEQKSGTVQLLMNLTMVYWSTENVLLIGNPIKVSWDRRGFAGSSSEIPAVALTQEQVTLFTVQKNAVQTYLTQGKICKQIRVTPLFWIPCLFCLCFCSFCQSGYSQNKAASVENVGGSVVSSLTRYNKINGKKNCHLVVY